MSDIPVPEGPEGITPDWLSAVLGRDVGDVTLTPIGEGKAFSRARLFRVEAIGAPPLVAKLGPEQRQARDEAGHMNRREVGFYTAYAAGLPVPQCHFAGLSEATGQTCVLIDDLSGSGAAEFQTGFTRDQAMSVARALARSHARHWGDPAVFTLPPVGMADGGWFRLAWPLYPQALAAVLPEVALSPVLEALGDAVAEEPLLHLDGLVSKPPLTLLHGDCQADNVVFAACGEAVFLDWQFMGHGRGICDLAYMMISSLEPEVRRGCERAVIAEYAATLAACGVEAPSVEVLSVDYARAAILKLMMTVGATLKLDNLSAAKRAWRRTDLERLQAFVADHADWPQAFEVLP